MINEIIKVNSKYRERVNSFISENKLFIKPNFKPIFVEDLINWKITMELSKTETIYLQSLLIVKDLIKYKLSNNDDFSEIALKIIEKWWEDNQDNDIAWNEHAVAERTLNIIYFQENSSKKLKFKKYNLILQKHLEYLYATENYKKNNHGLMMDRSLLIGSYYTKNELFRERAIDRFYIFVYRDFSTSGIHLENSPEYHSLAVKIAKEFIHVLGFMNIIVDSHVKTIVNKASLYIPKLARPDSSIPLLGDSGYKKLHTKKVYKNIVDHTSGVFLYQDFEHKNWLLTSNGYQRKTHKHKDDMSLQFSIDKFNIFVDSGKYNYDANSEIRKYLLSDKAHSKPFILERRFKFDGKDRLRTNIILEDDDIYHIEMTFHKPNDFQIMRNVILHKKTSSLFIVDRFSSKEKLNFISNFVMNPDLSIKLTDNVLNFSELNYSLSSPSKITVRSKENEKYNWYSSSFNQYENTNRAFISTSGNYSHHTIIFSNNDNFRELSLESNSIKLNINQEKIEIGISKIERWKTL